MNLTELFLIAMAVILIVPFLIWKLGRTEYFAPLVVVQIVTGILLGPGILGAVWSDAYNFLFTKPVITTLNGIAWWGVSLFVFFAGVELDLKRLKTNKTDSAITAGFALGTPLIVGSLAALVLLNWPGWIGDRAQTWQFVLGIGMASAVTALPILILFMQKLEILRQPLGQRILRYASLDDIAIWSVLAIVLMDWNRLGQQGIFLVLFATCAWLFRKFIHRLDNHDRVYVSLIWLALVALGADWCGLHYMVGAFLAGAIIDRDMLGEEFMDNLRDIVLMVMMPVFFLSTGLRTNWEMGGLAVILAALFMFAAQFVGKVSGIHIAGRLQKWGPGEANLVGCLLQTKALIEIIFVSVLLDKGIITSQMFTVMLLMAILSTMVTIPMATPMLKKFGHLIKKS
jgi:Kef-type K+ transport system membrane component KefB